MDNIEIKAIKMAWKFCDIYPKSLLISGARLYDIPVHGYINNLLVECEITDPELLNLVTFYIEEHYNL